MLSNFMSAPKTYYDSRTKSGHVHIFGKFWECHDLQQSSFSGDVSIFPGTIRYVYNDS